MQPAKQLTFDRFRLDPANECLWQGSQAIALRPKAYAVLKHLVDHRGQLVTKQQLLDAVWPGTFVGDAVLKVTIAQLRETLGDTAESPKYIETAHRRGYRFIGSVTEDAAPDAGRRVQASSEPPTQTDRVPLSPQQVQVLGREAEFAKMRTSLDRAIDGERQVLFVTGEPGIGKTTLVTAFVERVAAPGGMWIARGQCLEHYGAGEAYLPVLDALSRLARTPAGEKIQAVIRRHAPAWTAELPSLFAAAERESLPPAPGGSTRERMLREIADAMEAMAAEAPLLLVLEDLHWSDYSTLDLIAYLARRRDASRLMVIGTYRPVDVILSDHPLKAVKRELQAHALCVELPLEYLTEAEVAQYVDSRFPGHQLPRRLSRLIHRRTEGNPLFMTNVVQFLLDERLIVASPAGHALRDGVADIESGVPENVRQLIEKQIDRLAPDERLVLEGASVVGLECSSIAIAAGLEQSTAWVEERCEALVRRHQFLSPARIVELPDGTITPRYKFSHVLYLEVPYGLIPPMRRAEIHRRIGRSGEIIYGDRFGEIAAELAMHFEQGRDRVRAVKYLLQAAQNAAHRSAHHEAAALARRGLQALDTLDATPERRQQEIGLRLILIVSLMATRGFAAGEVEQQCTRALELCDDDADPQAFMLRWLLGMYRYFAAELTSAREISGDLLRLASERTDRGFLIEAHRASGVVLVEMGRFADSLDDLNHVAALCASQPDPTHALFFGQDPHVVSECFAARALWALGYPDQALARARNGSSLARGMSHVESTVIAAHFGALIHQLRGEAALAKEAAETATALADEYGLELWLALGHMNRGWALAEEGRLDEGIQLLRRGLAASQATGARLWTPHFLGLLAVALGKAGSVEDGLAAVQDALALVDSTGETCCAAELHRIRGNLLLAASPASVGNGSMASQAQAGGTAAIVAEAEASFARAMAIAREQQARSWELRIATSLAQLHQQHTRQSRSRRLLQETCDWFTEGRDTADVKRARAVLKTL